MNDWWGSDPFGVTPELISSDRTDSPPIPAPDPRLEAEIAEIRARQAVFEKVVDGLIEVYRTFDKTRRPEIKKGLKAVYAKLTDLGVACGVSRFALDHVWQG